MLLEQEFEAEFKMPKEYLDLFTKLVIDEDELIKSKYKYNKNIHEFNDNDEVTYFFSWENYDLFKKRIKYVINNDTLYLQDSFLDIHQFFYCLFCIKEVLIHFNSDCKFNCLHTAYVGGKSGGCPYPKIISVSKEKIHSSKIPENYLLFI